MDLTGLWRAAVADEALRRSFHLPEFDDDGWEEVTVPGHWRDVAALADAEEVLYRRRFEFTERTDRDDDATDAMAWLELDGLFSQGDVYVDGRYLGDTEGYFVSHAFDITELLADRLEHEIALEVHCHPSGRGKRRAILGVYDGGSDLRRDVNPGGIWAPIRIRSTGPVRIDSLRAICVSADDRRAQVSIRATLVAQSSRSVRVVSELAGVDHEFDHLLAEGPNQVEWLLTVPRPTLWWPRALGEQALHDLVVRVETAPGVVSDHHAVTTGMRSLQMRRWRLEVNGQRLQVKGVNLAPSATLPADATVELIERDLQLAIGAGFDAVRPYAHVAPPSFYDLTDRLGLLVWQDLPLVGRASNSVRHQAVRQATAMVTQLGHHPSIMSWNAHVAPAPDWMQSEQTSLRQRVEKVLAHEAPTWSKSVLDRSVKGVFDNQDGSRPATAYTGVLPHPPRMDGSATHLWFGWRSGSERDLTDFAARLPSQVRWVAEMGAQSIPAHPAVAARIDWPRPAPSVLRERLGYEIRSFDRYVPFTGHDSLESWTEASQLYQAGLLRRQIEALRRLKYRPNGGFFVHFLADAEPAISASLLDHDRAPKLAYQTVTEACLPVIVVADRLPASVRPGDPIALDVHVVSDERSPLRNCRVDAELTWPGDAHRWRFAGTVDADSVTRIGTLSWVVPDTPGLATLHLRLSGGATAVNRYDTTIRPR